MYSRHRAKAIAKKPPTGGQQMAGGVVGKKRKKKKNGEKKNHREGETSLSVVPAVCVGKCFCCYVRSGRPVRLSLRVSMARILCSLDKACISVRCVVVWVRRPAPPTNILQALPPSLLPSHSFCKQRPTGPLVSATELAASDRFTSGAAAAVASRTASRRGK